MILLDTDHVTVLRDPLHSRNVELVSRLRAAGDAAVFPTVISLEEQMRGWLAEIKRRSRAASQAAVYEKLIELVAFYGEWGVVQFTIHAAGIFDALRAGKVRVASQDLKIASIALAHDALLLSANLVDFQRVPGLKGEDWLYGPAH